MWFQTCRLWHADQSFYRSDFVSAINVCACWPGRLLQACNRKRDNRKGKGKNPQRTSHVEVVRLLLEAAFKLRDAPVTVEDKQPAGAGGGLTMGEHVQV
jgi:hypothetical protein